VFETLVAVFAHIVEIHIVDGSIQVEIDAVDLARKCITSCSTRFFPTPPPEELFTNITTLYPCFYILDIYNFITNLAKHPPKCN
jgi:hypothetical protein